MRFKDPLLSARARRAILIQCQNDWDTQVAQQAGHKGYTNHLTIVIDNVPHEFVVVNGTRIPYPPELGAKLQQARLWAKKLSSQLPALDLNP